MPAKDAVHDVVVEILRAEGWSVVRDPYTIKYFNRSIYIDLLIEHQITSVSVLLEVKSYLQKSDIELLQDIAGHCR